MRAALAAALLLAFGCGGDDDGDNDDYTSETDGAPAPDAAPASYEPGDPITLSEDNPKEDEDPSVLGAADGTMAVAWFGRVRRLGADNADIFLRTTRDGVEWSDLVTVTSDTWEDFAPHLIQTSDGWFHLTWFRRAPAPTYESWVMHTRSMDLHDWEETERRVADAATIEDWVPTIAERPDGDLQIVFVSRIRGDSGPHDLYTVTSSDGGATWSEAAPLAGLNDDAEQDHLPFLARTGAELTLAWNRCDADPATPWSNPTSDLMLATSADGDTWSQPRAITDDDEAAVLDVFPALFADHAGAWSLVWVTTALSATGSVVTMPTGGHYPADRGELPAMTGYSPKIAATPTDGVFLGAWVEGATGEQDIRVRFFSAP